MPRDSPFNPDGRRSERPAMTLRGRCGPHRALTLWPHSGTLAHSSSYAALSSVVGIRTRMWSRPGAVTSLDFFVTRLEDRARDATLRMIC